MTVRIGYKLCLGFSLLLYFLQIRSQCLYKVDGTFQKKSAQGMAIIKSRAILLNNTGLCRIYDLKRHVVLSHFRLDSYNANNHSNCATVGVEKIVKCPLLYISECRSPYRCFVECIMDSSSKLVQTIHVDRDSLDGIVHNWVVDNKGRSLYAISNLKTFFRNEKKNTHRITRYRLPKMKEGQDVTLGDKDKIESFDVEFPNLLQGACIKGKYLYLPTGLQKGNEKRKDSVRMLIIVNLRKHRIERKVNLTDITENEPEDCDFYKGKLLLFCGQSGGIYQIPTK